MAVCELAETTLGSDRWIGRGAHLHAQEDQAEFAYCHHEFITNWQTDFIEALTRIRALSAA